MNHLLPAFSAEHAECGLQHDPLLFSCAGSSDKYRRLCPCRDYRSGQLALCRDCLWPPEGRWLGRVTWRASVCLKTAAKMSKQRPCSLTSDQDLAAKVGEIVKPLRDAHDRASKQASLKRVCLHVCIGTAFSTGMMKKRGSVSHTCWATPRKTRKSVRWMSQMCWLCVTLYSTVTYSLIFILDAPEPFVCSAIFHVL